MNLIVDDYCTLQTGIFLEEQYNKFHDCIVKYKSILNDLVDKGIVSGETSDAIKEFRNQVAVATSQPSTSASALGKKYKRNCNNYIKTLDDVDDILY